tara:strand:+ start:180697 stop:181890 length:1194 start_codon:yes stop_codon:yes gene_type:complete
MNANMQKNLFLKICVVAFATLLALFVAEFIVRVATVYPNTLDSNRVFDENVGFRASQKIPEIDSYGYRNRAGLGREWIALGDSQTFGNNVRSAEAWPARLGKALGKDIYNLGLGGYGLLSYHALLKRERHPETKAAIVALYPTNDFELFYASDADCLILNNPSTFWQEERQKLNLEWPAYPIGCLHNDYDDQSGFYGRLKQRIALLALTHDGLAKIAGFFGAQQRRKFPSWNAPGDALTFPDGVDPISRIRIEKHERSVDLEVPEVAAMWKNLPVLLGSWKAMAQEGLDVGIMVIPSRERVIYEFFARQNKLGELDPGFVESLQKQIRLEMEIRGLLETVQLPFVFALEDTHRAHLYGRQRNILTYPRRNDGHPLSLGYAAYASAARRLVDKMGLLQ